MQKSKSLMILLVSAILFIFSISVLATSASYSDTAPSLWDKTLATGTKSNATWYASHVLKDTSETGFRCWIDCKNSAGNWATVTGYLDIANNGKTYSMRYSALPAVGVDVRLRAGANMYTGGKTIKGWIDFN
ncbi:MAG: hypothetical protein SPK23_05550 [Eubacteriales bacterium]|nr:hypothetical protein [Clostridiales bacterium]MDY5836564.1 hypothetical protein [Eubacteriales bacterium]